jgi:hypothetical protein
VVSPAEVEDRLKARYETFAKQKAREEVHTRHILNSTLRNRVNFRLVKYDYHQREVLYVVHNPRNRHIPRSNAARPCGEVVL